MSEFNEENRQDIGLEFLRPGRLSILEKDAADFLKRAVDISKALDEGKKPPLRTEPYAYELPYELGPAATRGIFSVLEKIAESKDKQIDPEVTARAGHLAGVLNEQLGENRDKGLLDRIAKAAIEQIIRVF